MVVSEKLFGRTETQGNIPINELDWTNHPLMFYCNGEVASLPALIQLGSTFSSLVVVGMLFVIQRIRIGGFISNVTPVTGHCDSFRPKAHREMSRSLSTSPGRT